MRQIQCTYLAQLPQQILTFYWCHYQFLRCQMSIQIHYTLYGSMVQVETDMYLSDAVDVSDSDKVAFKMFIHDISVIHTT